MNTRRIEFTVSVWVDEDALISDVIAELDYSFTYDGKVLETEITDVNTEI